MNKIAQDLPVGQRFEDYIVKKLWDRHKLKAKRIKGKHSAFDVKIDSLDQTIECKKDLKSKYTGNIAIEFECYDKPSGISVSTADYWAIQFYHDNRWKYGFVATEVLRKECEGLRKISGGDDMQSQMYLMPVTRFLEIRHAFLAHSAERSLGKTEVLGSNPRVGSIKETFVSHGMVTHPVSKIKDCDFCLRVQKEFEEALKSGELSEVI